MERLLRLGCRNLNITNINISMATIIDLIDYIIVLKQEIQKLNQVIQHLETLNKEKLSKK